MKVICNRGALLEALILAGSVVAAGTPKPVLQCVKIEADGSELTVSGTDLEVAIRCRDLQVEVNRGGEVVVPADRIRDIVRESVDDTLALEASGEVLNVRGQDSHFKILTQASEQFPPVPGYEGKADFEILGGQMRTLINQTAFAAARESSRYAFNGVLFNIIGKRITLVGTDGRRLAESRGDLASVAKTDQENRRAIVPIKALTIIDRLISDPAEPVGFQIKENQIIAHTSSATLTSSLVEGQIPPYEDVIPKEVDKKLTASTQDLLSAVKRASLLVSEESKGIRLSFNKKGVVLSTQSPGAGEATVTFPCKFEGADMEIGFNPAFLVDALKVIDSDDVTLELTTPNRPGLLRGGPNYQYVIMPVNLS